MEAVDFRTLEGVLYGMRGPAEPRYGRAMPRTTRPAPGPRSPLTMTTERRVDVSFSLRTLSSAERDLLAEHYGGVRRHPARARRPVLLKLLKTLAAGEPKR
jgi:hypothetical protein